jgi:hypothetical protein
VNKLLFLTTALIFCSCSLFEPRVPEDPSDDGVVWQDPTSPDIVVENMQSALNGLSVQYTNCFAESFVFYADTNDIDEYPSYNFADWTLDVEGFTVSQLFSIVPEDSTVSAVFTVHSEHPDPAAPSDSVTIYRDYAITVPQSQHSGTGTPAVGIAELKMIEDEYGLWTIKEWRDLRYVEVSFVTWAVAKAAYR